MKPNKIPRGILVKSSTDKNQTVINENDIDTKFLSLMQSDQLQCASKGTIQIRGSGEFKGLGFFLTGISVANWTIVKDSEDQFVLIPLKK